jgi:hypothetical protein
MTTFCEPLKQSNEHNMYTEFQISREAQNCRAKKNDIVFRNHIVLWSDVGGWKTKIICNLFFLKEQKKK